MLSHELLTYLQFVILNKKYLGTNIVLPDEREIRTKTKRHIAAIIRRVIGKDKHVTVKTRFYPLPRFMIAYNPEEEFKEYWPHIGGRVDTISRWDTYIQRNIRIVYPSWKSVVGMDLQFPYNTTIPVEENERLVYLLHDIDSIRQFYQKEVDTYIASQKKSVPPPAAKDEKKKTDRKKEMSWTDTLQISYDDAIAKFEPGALRDMLERIGR